MFDFPNAPSNGQLVQGSAGQIYAWDGVKWKAQMPPGPLAVNQGGTGVNNVAAAPWVELTGDVMTGLLTLSGDPTAAMHAATKQYVDSKGMTVPVTVPQGGTGAITLPVTIPGGPGPPALTGAFLLGHDASPVTPASTTTSIIGSTVNPGANLNLVSAVNGAANTIQMYRATGTLAAPGPITNGIPLGVIYWGGYDGTWWYPYMAQISVSPTEDWSGTKHGTQMAFYVTKTGTNNTSVGMTLDGNGTLKLNAAAPSMILNDSSGNNYNSILFRRNNGIADQHDWEVFSASNGEFQIRTLNDAYSAAASGFTFKRAASGVGIAAIETDAGDFITRHIQVKPNVGNPVSAAIVMTPIGAGGNEIYGFGNNAQGRWLMQLGDGQAETGGNVGSNFKIHRYADDGSYLGCMFTMYRNSGIAEFTVPQLLISSYNDAVEIRAPNSTGLARIRYHVPSIRIWTCGASGNSGSADFWITDESASAGRLAISGGSGTCWSTNGTWNSLSDIATKKDIEPYDERGLAELTQLRPVKFKYNGELGSADDGIQRYGLIAQEVEPLFPEVINTLKHDDTDVLGVDSGRLIYAVINALKEIDTRLVAGGL